MKIFDLYQSLDSLYPFASAERWDWVGLLAGDLQESCTGIVIGLDPQLELIEKAKSNGCNLIVTHHPPCLKPHKSLRPDVVTSKFHYYLLRNGMHHLTLHTNFDQSPHNGLEEMAKSWGLNKTTRLFPSDSKFALPKSGYGLRFDLHQAMDWASFKSWIQPHFSKDKLLAYPTNDHKQGVKKIQTIGFLNGSGSSFIYDFKPSELDVYITGDVTHHKWMDSHGLEISLVDPGHAPSEEFFIERLKKNCLDCDKNIPIHTVAPSVPLEVI